MRGPISGLRLKWGLPGAASMTRAGAGIGRIRPGESRITIDFSAVFRVAVSSSAGQAPVSIHWLIVAGACAPFGFNVIPALLPAIQSEFGQGQAGMQWLVSVYALTMALGQLVAGPLSDACGRRRVLLAGLLLYVAASIGAALADSYGHLLAYRFVQGLGASAVLVVPRAVVRDLFSGAEAARAMAQVMIAFAVVPAIAPVIGGLLQMLSGWRASFVACAVLGATLFVLAWRLHGETLAPARRVRAVPWDLLQGYAALFNSWRYCAYAFSFSLLNCSFIGFFVVGPTFLSRAYGMTPLGIALAMLAGYGGFAAGNTLAVRHVLRAGVDRMLACGLVFGGAGTLMLVAVAGQAHWQWMLVAVAVQSFGTGLAFATGMAGANAVHPQRAGTAAAMTGTIQLLTGAIFAMLSGIIYDGSLKPLAWSSLALCVIAGFLIRPLWQRRAPLATR